MSKLRVRLLLVLGAAVLVGLVIINVAFLFWGQRRYQIESRLALNAALFEIISSQTIADNPSVTINQIASHYKVTISLVNVNGEVLATKKISLPSFNDRQLVEANSAWLHKIVRLQNSPWHYAIVSQPRTFALSAVFTEQPWAIIVLLSSGLFIVLLASFFLRRVVIAPLQHVTDLVHHHQLEGLQELSIASSNNDFAKLSQAIITMNQTIDEERQRIANQVKELTLKNTALATAQNDVVRAERLAAVGKLAAGIAHEVGNPLAILAGYLDMLKSGTISGSEQTSAIAHMRSELDRINTTIRTLLDYSRAQNDAEQIPGDLIITLERVKSLLAPQLHNVVLELPNINKLIALPITTDAATQLLLNLILNAIDAINKSGRIIITVEQTEQCLCIHCDDDGPGIPEANRHQIFEPFFTTKPAGKGTGLGLAVCERIVSNGNGTISVKNSPILGGARFTVVFNTQS
ncbi:MAG: GHKL domain-containing protein [Deltaproteobacteria bacterium]|nr:GHKL domain-containing protein [Deltaproteobacteria bacterium]